MTLIPGPLNVYYFLFTHGTTATKLFNLANSHNIKYTLFLFKKENKEGRKKRKKAEIT